MPVREAGAGEELGEPRHNIDVTFFGLTRPAGVPTGLPRCRPADFLAGVRAALPGDFVSVMAYDDWSVAFFSLFTPDPPADRGAARACLVAGDFFLRGVTGASESSLNDSLSDILSSPSLS